MKTYAIITREENTAAQNELRLKMENMTIQDILLATNGTLLCGVPSIPTDR